MLGKGRRQEKRFPCPAWLHVVMEWSPSEESRRVIDLRLLVLQFYPGLPLSLSYSLLSPLLRWVFNHLARSQPDYLISSTCSIHLCIPFCDVMKNHGATGQGGDYLHLFQGKQYCGIFKHLSTFQLQMSFEQNCAVLIFKSAPKFQKIHKRYGFSLFWVFFSSMTKEGTERTMWQNVQVSRMLSQNTATYSIPLGHRDEE